MKPTSVRLDQADQENLQIIKDYLQDSFPDVFKKRKVSQNEVISYSLRMTAEKIQKSKQYKSY